MHRYFPHTEEDERRMLETIGAPSTEALFASVPEACRHNKPLNLTALDEWQLTARATELAAMQPTGNTVWVGAGSYQHHIPATVTELSHRSEFYTSYTPYQAEMSQGTLQGIFEFQTMIARLLGMEVANASMYDGGTALAEGVLMACRVTKRYKVAISSLIHPHYRQILRTYCVAADVEMVELPAVDGRTDLALVTDDNSFAAVVIHSPNMLGIVEDIKTCADFIHERKGLLIVGFTEAMAYGLLHSPGSQGADIVCGEGQSFGISASLGGPALGLMATRKDFVRNFPGRLVGQTTDLEGRRAFVLTLSTREQHIRREKAVSNICSNSGLCALTCGMYLASMGGTGLQRMAAINHNKAEYLKHGLLKKHFETVFTGTTFNEFVLRAPQGFAQTHARLLNERGVLFGMELSSWSKDLAGCYLFCATETRSRQEIDAMLEEI